MRIHCHRSFMGWRGAQGLFGGDWRITPGMRPPTSSLVLIYLALDFAVLIAAEPPRGANSATEEQAAIAAWFQKHDALPQDGKGMLIEQIGQVGSAADLRRLFAQAAA